MKKGSMLDRAAKNVAKWGEQDLLTLGVAAAEELGELADAIHQHRSEGTDRKFVDEESVDLGALCIQIIAAKEKGPPDGEEEWEELLSMILSLAGKAGAVARSALHWRYEGGEKSVALCAAYTIGAAAERIVKLLLEMSKTEGGT